MHGNLTEVLISNTILYDISRLTEDEKQYHISYAIEQAQTRYLRRMQSIGLSVDYIQEKFNEIDWKTKVNEQEVLENAAARKYWHLERLKTENERKIQEDEQRRNLSLKYTKDWFKETIRHHFVRKHGLYINSPAYESYVCELVNFMTEPTNKGLLIIGNSGTGKTETLKAIAKNELKPLNIVSILDINNLLQHDGFVELNPRLNYVIDDVGSETTPVKFYGTDLNWFKDFIESAYMNSQNWSNLIITTNLGGERIGEKYGIRVRSRLKEMFKIVNIKADDFRNKQ